MQTIWKTKRVYLRKVRKDWILLIKVRWCLWDAAKILQEKALAKQRLYAITNDQIDQIFYNTSKSCQAASAERGQSMEIENQQNTTLVTNSMPDKDHLKSS